MFCMYFMHQRYTIQKGHKSQYIRYQSYNRRNNSTIIFFLSIGNNSLLLVNISNWINNESVENPGYTVNSFTNIKSFYFGLAEGMHADG